MPIAIRKPKSLVALVVALLLGWGGAGSGSSPGVPSPSPLVDPWQSITTAFQLAQTQFPGGLMVEVMTSAGLVYSRSFGGFSNTDIVPLASASKWVSAPVLLRLVERGVLSLDTQTKTCLTNCAGSPSGALIALSRIRRRH